MTTIIKNRKAQSILEYIIVLTAIVAAILVVAGTVKTKVRSAVDTDATGAVQTAATKFSAIAP